MELINAADLYAVRRSILAGVNTKMSLTEVDALIAYNATHEFMPYGVRMKLEEALRDGTDRQATGSNPTLH